MPWTFLVMWRLHEQAASNIKKAFFSTNLYYVFLPHPQLAINGKPNQNVGRFDTHQEPVNITKGSLDPLYV